MFYRIHTLCVYYTLCRAQISHYSLLPIKNISILIYTHKSTSPYHICHRKTNKKVELIQCDRMHTSFAEHVQKCSEIFRNIQKYSEMFRNVQKYSESLNSELLRNFWIEILNLHRNKCAECVSHSRQRDSLYTIAFLHLTVHCKDYTVYCLFHQYFSCFVHHHRAVASRTLFTGWLLIRTSENASSMNQIHAKQIYLTKVC